MSQETESVRSIEDLNKLIDQKSQQQEHDKSRFIPVAAFIVSLINLSGTIISLLTTDTNILTQRITGIVQLFSLNQNHLPVYLVLSFVLLTISYYELKNKIIPDMVTIPGVITGIGLTAIFHHISIWSSIGGAVSGILLFFFLFVVTHGKGIGFGNVKMQGMLGAFLGPINLFVIDFIGFAIGFLYIFFYRYLHKDQQFTQIEFGPVVALATGIFIILQPIYIKFFSTILR